MWEFNRFYERKALMDDEGNCLTYKQLDDRQKAFAQNIEGRPLVFLVCENTIDCIVTYVSCIVNKIPVMMVSGQICDDNLQDLLENFKPGYLYRKGKLVRKLEVSDNDIHSELALLLSTSGSTGKSKCVRISYDNLLSNTKAIISELEIKIGDVTITSLPLNYCYGLSMINTHLLVGGTILVTKEKIISTKFWKFASENNVSTFAGVPYTYEVLKRLKIFDNIHLKKLLQAGGRLDSEMETYLRQYCFDRGIKLYLMYGQTEATARMSVLKAGIDNHLGSVGQAIIGGRFECAPETGEIIYYGKNVSMGYAYAREDLAKGDDNKGKLHTRDVGYIDSEGYLYVTGRMDSDSMEEIIAFITVLGNAERKIVLYKQQYPISLLKRDKYMLAPVPHKNRLKKVEQDILRVDFNFQFCLIDNVFYVSDIDKMEKICSFHTLIINEAKKSIEKISEAQILDNVEVLEDDLDNVTFARKLTRIYKDSKVLGKVSNKTIVEFVTKHSYFKKNPLKTKGDTFVLDTKKSKETFIKLMNDDFLKSELTDYEYEALAKNHTLEK